MPEGNENDIDHKQDELIGEIRLKMVEVSIEAQEIVMDEIEKIFDFEGGKIIITKNFVDKLNKLTEAIMRRLEKSPKFSGLISGFVKRIPELSSEISKFQLKQNKIKVPPFEAAKKVVVDEIINAMLGNGLNNKFVQPLRDIIFRNASAGGFSLSQARNYVKQYIGDGKDESGKLKSYLEQTATQGVTLYTGAINKKLMDTFNYNGMLITGTIIDNSSPQCIYCIRDLGGTIKRSDWSDVKKKATKKFPIIPGTTFDNLPINLLHWGCRHGFYPIML